MTIEEWKDKCSKMGFTAQEIADISGVPIDTVRAVIWGTQIPKFALWERIDEALKKSEANMVREALNYGCPNKREDYDINDYLAIPDGKFIVITGPNGGGKSTLARLIMGLEQPKEMGGECLIK